MSTLTPTAYIVTPVTNHPKETGLYYVMNANREILPRMDRCVDGKWDNNNRLLIFYWLRPVDLSRMLEDCWDAAIAHHEQEETSPGLAGPRNPKPNKFQYLSSINKEKP